MAKITEMKECRNKDRVNIYIDGEFCTAIDKFVAYKSFLKVGKEISVEQLEQLAFEEERESALKKAIAYVTQYRVTEKKARDYLKGKEYSKAVIEETMEKLKKYSFISDEQYAVDFMQSRLKSKGAKLIKMELSQKGISRDIISALETNPEDETEACKKQAEKYMKRKEKTRENYAKLFQNLAGKGFDFGIIKSVIEEIKGETEIEDWM
ncbi:MAG: RecX family transcriptional regulator [Bacillota bacterium]